MRKPFFICSKGVIDLDPEVIVPVDVREMTRFETDKGDIHIIHEITIGDLLVTMSIVALLIFIVLSRIIRR